MKPKDTIYLEEHAVTYHEKNILLLRAYNKTNEYLSHEIQLPLVKFVDMLDIFGISRDLSNFEGGAYDVLPEHLAKLEKLMGISIDVDYSKYDYTIVFYTPSLVDKPISFDSQ